MLYLGNHIALLQKSVTQIADKNYYHVRSLRITEKVLEIGKSGKKRKCMHVEHFMSLNSNLED